MVSKLVSHQSGTTYYHHEIFKRMLSNEFMALILYKLIYMFLVYFEIHKFPSQVEVLPAVLETLIDKTL